MSQITIPRTLWSETKKGRETFDQTQLIECTESIVILGEAGMGKTHLLKSIAKLSGFVHCTARRLINSFNANKILGSAQVLVIDALDEVSAKGDSDAIDSVLTQLEQLGYPKFILSCRVADWHSATGVSIIEEHYSHKPLELHLYPLQDSEIIEYLGSRLGEDRASSVIEHFKSRGLIDLLGNPQTLLMIAQISANGLLPENRAEIYQFAVENLAAEHNDKKETQQMSVGALLDVAGAAFAGLIVTGSEAIARKAIANLQIDELSFSDLKELSGTSKISEATSSRLFLAIGTDRFSYFHRSIGEYLGARWLAKRADTPRKRRRLLSIFQSNVVIPASLRGLHAWLAQAPDLATEVIKADPMGVIEYGDADAFNANLAKILLDALAELAVENPAFRKWKSYSTCALVQNALLPEVKSLIVNKRISFPFRMLLLEAFKNSSSVEAVHDELYKLLMDVTEVFAIRSAASDALIDVKIGAEIENIITKLLSIGGGDSLRLAEELIDSTECIGISDTLIVDLVISYAAINDCMIGKFYRLQKSLPNSRMISILNGLSKKTVEMGEWYERSGHDDISELACDLIYRVIGDSEISVEKLWHWLSTIHPRTQYRSNAEEKLGKLINSRNKLRLDLYKLVLFELRDDRNIWEKRRCLQDSFFALTITEEDIINLLSSLEPANKEDERWRELIQLCYHNGERGGNVRLAAIEFAKQHPDGLDWLNNLANPVPSEWEVKDLERIERNRVKKQALHNIHRQDFLAHIDQLRAGEFASVVNPAQAYLKLYSDIGRDIPAHLRITEWLGNELSEAAMEGIEAYLQQEPVQLNADVIAKGKTENYRYYAEYIFIVAIAERIRNGRGIDDLANEKLLACLFSIWGHSSIEYRAGIGDVGELLEKSVIQRDLLIEAKRRYIEPQLVANNEYVDGLHSLMKDKTIVDAVCELASEWLFKFPNLSYETELILLERLLYSGEFTQIKKFLSKSNAEIDEKRRLSRSSIKLIIDFEHASVDFDNDADIELIWSIRNLFNGDFDSRQQPQIGCELIKWVISTFRKLWPMARSPIGTTSGRNHACDASDFISSLIKQLSLNLTEEAITALTRLKDEVEDGYTNLIKSVIAEQRQRIVEQNFLPPELKTISSVIRDATPVSMNDLQAYMIEELAVVQAKIKADDAESWQGFYDDHNIPYGEERCRDHLLGLLRQNISGIELLPEAHVAADKEVDVTCTTNGLRLPIEIKGQWHPELWRSADKQLDELYSSDYLAHGRGIYLVLWFGSQPKNKTLKKPRRGEKCPQTPEQLRDMLIEGSLAAREGRIKVFVLDIERSI
ncbi:MAG: hypothetical protein ACJAZT_001203 [Gammaproteobacteria bacterium]|jgi:hypothetical protein